MKKFLSWILILIGTAGQLFYHWIAMPELTQAQYFLKHGWWLTIIAIIGLFGTGIPKQLKKPLPPLSKHQDK
jgi:hypothetical protein